MGCSFSFRSIVLHLSFFLEQIVLTPKGKTSNSTILWIERKAVKNVTPGSKVYVAGGDHEGIVINKEEVEGENFKGGKKKRKGIFKFL